MRMPEDLNVSPATNSCATGKQTRASLLKIKMMMRPAPRIEPRAASRTTRLAAQILPNRQLRAASPAQNRPLLPLAARPNRNRMPRQRNMAILASVVHAAALHLDRDNIRRRVIVHTPRLRVEIDSAHDWRLLSALISHPPHQNQLRAPQILPKRKLAPKKNAAQDCTQAAPFFTIARAAAAAGTTATRQSLFPSPPPSKWKKSNRSPTAGLFVGT